MSALGLSCCVRAFSSCGERGLLFVVVRRLLIAVASLVVEHGPQVHRLLQLWLTGSRAQAQQLWRTGLVAPRRVGSSWTRTRTHVSCIGRRILNHCTTREALYLTFLIITNRGVLLASGGQNPIMLLNILRCTGQHPTTKNTQPKMSIVQLLRKHGRSVTEVICFFKKKDLLLPAQ